MCTILLIIDVHSKSTLQSECGRIVRDYIITQVFMTSLNVDIISTCANSVVKIAIETPNYDTETMKKNLLIRGITNLSSS